MFFHSIFISISSKMPERSKADNNFEKNKYLSFRVFFLIHCPPPLHVEAQVDVTMMICGRSKKRCVAITHSEEAGVKVRNIDAHRFDEKQTLKLSQAPHVEHVFFMWYMSF